MDHARGACLRSLAIRLGLAVERLLNRHDAVYEVHRGPLERALLTVAQAQIDRDHGVASPREWHVSARKELRQLGGVEELE
jgi:hypothetical protein